MRDWKIVFSFSANTLPFWQGGFWQAANFLSIAQIFPNKKVFLA